MSYLKNLLYRNLISLGINPGKNKFTLAVSGGADSTALFFIFLQLKNENKTSFTVCHLHHGIRKESDYELMYIKNLCKENKISLFYDKVNIPEIVKKTKMSIEIAAREERYKFYEKAKKHFNSDYIVTAHHLDDIIETFLLRLIKGTGLTGAKSILPVNGKYIRPFFNISKKEILKYLEENKIKFYQDITNYDNKYERNYIRNVILKEFEKFYPGYRKSIFSFIEIVKENERYINSQIPVFLIEKCFWDLNVVKKLNSYLIKRALEKKLRTLTKNKNVTKKEIEYIINKINKNTPVSGTVLQKKEFIIYKSYNKLYFFNDKYFLFVEKLNKNIKKKAINFGKNKFFYYIITAKERKMNDINLLKNAGFKNKKLSGSFYIDKEKIIGNLYISFRQGGDTIVLKPGISKKIKKIFNEKKIPFFIRDSIPIIKDDKNIIGLFLFNDIYFIEKLLKQKNIDDYEMFKQKVSYVLNFNYYVTEKTNKIIEIKIL